MARDVKLEVTAGLTTFLTMSYIVIVNPEILSATGLDKDALVTATVLAAASGSILMGLFAKLPYAVAPGMGINAFFAYELCIERQVPAEQALGLVVVSGIVFLVLSATPLRRAVAKAIPGHLREAIAGGIGIFLAYIGLKNAGIIVAHSVTLTTLGPLDGRHVLFLMALLLSTVLYRKGKPYAFLAGIGLGTILALIFDPGGWIDKPEQLISLPKADLIFAADLTGAFQLALLPPLITLLFTDLFDSLSTFLGVAKAANLIDENGEPLHIERALLVDASATLVSGLVGTSSATTYIESTSGIEVGGRTGLTAIVAGVAFLPLVFFAPVLGMIPTFVTAPILVLVGALMIRAVMNVGQRPFEEVLPSFVVLILIPLTFSITQGILWGFVLHPILFVLARRGDEIRPMMWVLFALAFALLGMEFGCC